MQGARHQHGRHARSIQCSQIGDVAHAAGRDHGTRRTRRTQARDQFEIRPGFRSDARQFHRDHPCRPRCSLVRPGRALRHAGPVIERQQYRYAGALEPLQCIALGQAFAAHDRHGAAAPVQIERLVRAGKAAIHPELDPGMPARETGDRPAMITGGADGIEIGDIDVTRTGHRDQRIRHGVRIAAIDQPRTQWLVSLPVAPARVNDLPLHEVDHRYQFWHETHMNQRIFVFEFITGGGLAGSPLPPSLAGEGALMRDTLLRDVRGMADTQWVTTFDARLPAPGQDAIAVDAGTFDAAFDAALDRTDAAFIVAPESGGLLATLAARVEASGRMLLGCDSTSCRIATSKSATARVLADAGIAALAHHDDPDALPDHPGPWAVKPDDGAGCDGLQRLADRSAAARALRAAGPGHIAQPWLAGEARSMNLLCARGRATLLSVNRQQIAERAGRIVLDALEVGAVAATDEHRALAQHVVAALPGLLGPVGVDFIETAHGPVVVEINPRMSTSACALRDATGLNIVAATLAAARTGELPAGVPTRPQHIALNGQQEAA